MTLITLTYGLPILLGYVLFAAISGRIIPLLRPKNPERRPAWLLGHWVGIAAATVLILAIKLALAMNVDALGSLLVPSALAFAALMLPGIMAYSMYKSRITRQLNDTYIEHTPEIVYDHASSPMSFDNEPDQDPDHFSIDLDATLDRSLDRALVNDLDLHVAAEDEFDHIDLSADELFEEVDTESPTIAQAPVTHTSILESEEYNAGFDEAHAHAVAAIQAMQQESHTAPEVDAAAEMESLQAIVDSAREEVVSLQQQLEAEIAEREKVEQHLRITRKGLAELESESKRFETDKVDALTKLENQLKEKEVRTSKAEALAQRESDKAAALESEILELRTEVLNAASENRASTEARARALSTANKATTFARQAVEVRAKLERQLKEKEHTLETRQTTISSLINALDKEKARTKEEVASLAKQMVLEEKQLQARRTIEDAARADSGFTSRLVKKVAKAKAENE